MWAEDDRSFSDSESFLTLPPPPRQQERQGAAMIRPWQRIDSLKKRNVFATKLQLSKQKRKPADRFLEHPGRCSLNLVVFPRTKIYENPRNGK